MTRRARVRWQGSTTERGYGSPHQKLRNQWQPIIATGQAWCTAPICLMRSRVIHPWQAWDLGHTPDRAGYTGPCHAKCNRSEGAARGNRKRATTQRTPAPLRRW